MSSGASPCSGYVIKATEENFEKLNVDLGKYDKRYEEYKKENPEDSLEDFLSNLITDVTEAELTATPDVCSGEVITVYLFRYDAEMGDIYDDLEDGIYFALMEEDLYHKELTDAGQALESEGILPEFKRWTQYG